MKNLILRTVFAFSGLIAVAIAADRPALIPTPKEIRWTSGDFVFAAKTRIVIPGNASADVRLAGGALVRAVGEVTGRQLRLSAGNPAREVPGQILLRPGLADAQVGVEGYRLTIGKAVVLEAVDGRGMYNGVQTIRQLLRPGKSPAMAGCEIRDWPAWPYRGVMLDPARNYMTLDFLKRQIDVLSSYKLNYFHLHLTDSNAWRLQVAAYPNLVSEKFYTREQLSELVAYAKARFVTLMPEIEMPGHSAAFIEKMPDLGHKGILCLGNEKTYQVLDTIWKETAGIFDGPYLHLGGDETKDYLDCPRCRSKWDELKTTANPPGSLVAYFIERMNSIIKSHGRQTVAWSADARHWKGSLPKDVVVMTWTSGAVEHARQGYPTINTFVKPLYFDHLHPIPAFLEWLPNDGVSENLPGLMGAEGEAWHDPPVTDEQKVLADLGFYPRLMAMSEQVWGPAGGAKKTAMADFEPRLLDHKARFFQNATFPYPPPSRDPKKPYAW